MNKTCSAVILILLLFPVFIKAQDKLSSENLDSQGIELDNQIIELNNKIAGVIKKYNLLKTTGIRVLPYQTSYRLGDNYIEIEKHLIIKDDAFKRHVNGIKKKRIRIYTNGTTVSRIESELTESRMYSDINERVFIVDPSPSVKGTDDMLFTHVSRGRKLLEKRELGKIKNTTAFPLRNEIKRNFIIPHLTQFYNALIFTAEAYYKSLKDADSGLTDFLKGSMKY